MKAEYWVCEYVYSPTEYCGRSRYTKPGIDPPDCTPLIWSVKWVGSEMEWYEKTVNHGPMVSYGLYDWEVDSVRPG